MLDLSDDIIISRGAGLINSPLEIAASQDFVMQFHPRKPLVGAYPFYDKLLFGFKEDLSELDKVLIENNCQLVPVPAGLSIEAVFNLVVVGVDPFVPRAIPITSLLTASKLEEVELGLTKDFCPVSIKNNNLLIKGNKSLAVKYLVYLIVCNF